MTTINTLTIGGIDFSSYVDITSLNLTEGLQVNSSSMSCDVVIDSQVFIKGTVPKPTAGQKVRLALSNGETFVGVLGTVTQRPYSGKIDTYKFSCDVTESVRLLDKRVVAERILPRFVSIPGVSTPSSGIVRDLQGSTYAGTLITYLVRKYAGEFKLNVDQGYPVPLREIYYESLSSVIDSIAHGIGFIWRIDDYTITFTNSLNIPAPVSSIDFDTTRDFGNVEIAEDTSRLVNRVFLKDFTAMTHSWLKDQFIADGTQSFFGLSNPPWNADSVSVSVTPPDGSPTQYTVSLDPISSRQGDIQGSPGQAFVCILNQGLRFPTSDIPEMGSTVDVNYPAVLTAQVLPVEDPDSIRMMKSRETGDTGPTDGVYEKSMSIPEFRVDNISTVTAYGLFVLDRLAWPIINGQMETMTIDGWKPGQNFAISSNKRNIYDYKAFWKTGAYAAPKMYVQNVSRKYVSTRESPTREINTISFSSLLSELLI